MKAFLFSLCYNILYTVGWLVTLPSYLLKQKRRGGFGTGLLERFGLYRVSYNREPKGVLYVHAVSVGEVVLALKFLRAWLRERGGSAVLATSTATGHATAVSAQIPGVRVIYAPFDLLGCRGGVLTVLNRRPLSWWRPSCGRILPVQPRCAAYPWR